VANVETDALGVVKWKTYENFFNWKAVPYE